MHDAALGVFRNPTDRALPGQQLVSWSVRCGIQSCPAMRNECEHALKHNGYKMASRRHDQPDNNSTRASYKPTTASTIASIISQFLQQLGILPQAILDLLILSTLIPHFLSSYFAMSGGKSFDTSKDIPDLSGKVILVTGGM